MSKPTLKDEFEKAFKSEFGIAEPLPSWNPKELTVALWAARWALENAIKRYDFGTSVEINIKSMIDELQ